ncbi:MAG: CDP-alcohol phosphatidyltransferase family protein [Syntrophobacteraceae bacterium]|nr:CDP-alcohol phosphatidyltransferase family protein [Syntrophobacteraceae bacterium]
MTQTAIILARDSLGTEMVFGVPAVRRLVLILRQLAFQKIHVVGRVDLVEKVVADLLSPAFLHSFGEKESPDAALERIELSPDERVLVLMANHVVDRHTLESFREIGQVDVPACLVGAGCDGLDEGVFLVGRSELLPIVRFLWLGEKLDDALSRRIRYIEAAGRLPHTLDGKKNTPATSEDALAAALGMQTHADDGFIARHFDRHISRRISSRVARTRMTPNGVTLVGMTIGLTAAFLLSLPGYWAHLLGSLLFVFCVIVDGVDGELARLKLQESRFGHYLDIITDNIVHFAIFVGIAFGLYHDTGNAWYLRILWVMLGGFGLCSLAVYLCILRLSEDRLKASPTAIRFMALLSNRDFAYLIALLAVADRLNWFLIGSALGSYVFAAALWTISYRERRKAPGAAQPCIE